MSNTYKKIVCIHPQDPTTAFLGSIGSHFKENYLVVNDDDNSHDETINSVKALPENCLIIFLGHGSSQGLYSADTERYPKRIFLDKNLAESLFKGHDLLMLSCNSSGFIKVLESYRGAIGFGNIISSQLEISVEAEYTGIFRKIDSDDITSFNTGYTNSILSALKMLEANKINFKNLTSYICYFLNNEINSILLNKDLKNRTEISKLFFEFRNETIIKLKN